MIDTHSHLLPWVDHGCPDLKTALTMARAAADAGTRLVVCTPHFAEWNPAKIQYSRVVAEQVRAAVSNNDIDLDLLLGFEVDLSVAATGEMKKLHELVVEGSRDVIIFEMPYSGWPLFLEDLIFRLASDGYTPVLAHPERNDRIQQSSELLERCVRGGAVAQATAGTLTGEFGSTAIKTFFRLIAEGLIDLVATDAHSFRQDNWTLEPTIRVLEERMSKRDAHRLTHVNPRLLLQGKPLERITATATPKSDSGSGSQSGWLRKRRGRGS